MDNSANFLIISKKRDLILLFYIFNLYVFFFFFLSLKSIIIFANLHFVISRCLDGDKGSIERSFSKEADCVIASSIPRRLWPRIWSNCNVRIRSRECIGERDTMGEERFGASVRKRKPKMRVVCTTSTRDTYGRTTGRLVYLVQ